MAARSSLAAKRRLSLDILAASKANDSRLQVWTLQNTPARNGAADNSNLHNGAISTASPAVRKKKTRVIDSKKQDGEKKKQPVKSQVSEVKLTLSQKYLSWRFATVLLLQSSFVVAIFLRNCLPMAMVCMVKPGAPPPSAHDLNKSDLVIGLNATEFQDLPSVSHNASIYNRSIHWKEPVYEFEWNPEVQGLVLTSIMFSSFVGPLLFSVIKEKLNSKMTLTIFSLLSTVMTFASPTAARINPYCLVAVRIILGICVNGNVPMIGDFLAWWSPQEEKLTNVALVFTGVNIGSILVSVVSGYLCLVPLDHGWPFVFYTFGTINLIWCIAWHFLASQKPEEHRYISEKEKEYIISHRTGLNQPSGGVQGKPPYRLILTSLPVLAYCATTMCHVWSTLIVFTYLPVFVNKVMKFSVQETGLLVSLTSTFRMIGTFIWTVIGNKLAHVISTNKSRKICICTGFMLGGIASIIVGFFDHNYKWLVLALLIVLMLAQSVGSSTNSAVPLDMAPRYAGLLTGMCLSLASLVGVSGPLLVASITAGETQEEWRTVWLIMGCVFSTGSVIFLSFGHASLQPWATGIETQWPNIMLPFVTLGRRFSTFLEAPPLSPLTSRVTGFDFSVTYKSPTANVLTQMATATPDVFYTGNFDFGKSIIAETNVEPTLDNQDSEDAESIETDDDIIEEEEDQAEQIKKIRRRAVSEPALEVLRFNLAQEAIHEEPEPIFEFEWRNKAVEDTTIQTKAETDSIHTEGVVNYAYEDGENIDGVLSDDIEISRL